MELDDKVNSLLEKLKYKLNDNDPNIQEEYFKILDKVIDAGLFIRYDDISLRKEFSSLNQLDEIVIYTFNTINDNNKERTLKNLTSKVAFATGAYSDKEYSTKLYESFDNLYDIYLKTNNTLSHDWTTEFYNEILNRQQDNYIKNEKNKTIKKITSYFPLTDKKRKSMEISAKLKKANMYLSERNFIKLNIPEKELHQKLEDLHLYLNKIKPFCNNNGIDDKDFRLLDNLFLNGILSFDKIRDIFTQYKSSDLKIILNKYSKLLLPYIDNIKVMDEELDFDTVDFNYNHLKITNKNAYYRNLKRLVKSMTGDEINYILNNISNLEEIFKLIPLASVMPEFQVLDLKAILLNYDKITNNLIEHNKIPSNFKFNHILNNLYEVIKLSRAYSSTDKYVRAVLDEGMISKILTEKQTSRIPRDYVDVYIKMISNYETTIPPIEGEINGYRFESGNNYDLDRLMIGKNCVGSCLGPRGVGKNAYNMALTSKNSDVIIFTKEDKFVGRIVLFRKGNYIVMAPIQGPKGLNKALYSSEVLDYIGNKICDVAKNNNDNLDYIFLTYDSIKLLKNHRIVESKLFKEGFPHCDLEEQAYLITSNKDDDILSIDDNLSTTYKKKRKETICKKDNYKEDILRIRALQIFMSSIELSSKLKTNFSNINDYERVYIGQDFYIGINKDKTIDKVILNTNDIRQKEEIERIINGIIEYDSSDYELELLASNNRK